MAEFKQEDTIDWPMTIIKRINAIADAKAKSKEVFILEVETLDDIMTWYWDNDYIKELNNIDDSYRNDIKGVKSSFNPQDNELISNAQFKRARLVFRALMKLIPRSGFLPFKEMEGIIDEEDFKDVNPAKLSEDKGQTNENVV